MLFRSRGYTGHEQLNEFNLINMNGRIYDPVVGRVLSPDNLVQDGFSTQGFNRYSYALNNPLKYADPDGNFAFIPFLITAVQVGSAIIEGAFISGTVYTLNAAITGQSLGGMGQAMLFGGITGGMSFGIGSLLGPVGGVGREFARAGVHGLSGGVTTWAQGGNFGSGFLTSAVGSLVGSGTDGLPGGVQIGASSLLGGVASELSGGSFLQGAVQAGLVTGLNHLMHQSMQDPPKKTKSNTNETLPSLEGAEHVIGPGLTTLTSPTPKRFIMPNSSGSSSVLSESMAKLFPQKINYFGAKRLYTHTVNGIPRYAATWGRFIGRWGTKVLGPIGIGLTVYDFSDMVWTNYQNATPIQQQWMANPYRFYGAELWKKN